MPPRKDITNLDIHISPCDGLQELRGKMQSFERWQKEQNGTLGRIEAGLTTGLDRSADDRNDMRAELLAAIKDVRVEAASAATAVRAEASAAIKEVRDNNNSFKLWLLGALASSLVSMALLVANLIFSHKP